MKHYNIPIFLPELACPFRCVYCNQQSIASQHHVPDVDEVRETVHRHLSSFPAVDRIVEIAFFGGNFTGLPANAMVDYLEAVQPFLDSGAVQSLRCSTRPDYITPKILNILKQYRMKHIELGAQSTNDDVLRNCGRGHDFICLQNAANMILEKDFVLGLQMMTGLPGSSAESDMETAYDIVSLHAAETRIYPCIVVRGTRLEKQYRKGCYRPQSLKEAVQQACDLYMYFLDNHINVLRIGLHHSEELDKGDYIAGPYHHNFAEMVYGLFWKRKFDIIKADGDRLTIKVHPSQRTKAIGYHAANREDLLQRFREVEFVSSDSLSAFDFSYLVEKTDRFPFFVASSAMPDAAKTRLTSLGKVLWLDPADIVYSTIATHPDIYFFPFASNGLVFAPNVPKTWIAELHRNKIKLVKGGKPLGKRHPETTYYNACSSENLLIHRLKHTDHKILDLCRSKRHIDVRQAYTRCNLLAISDTAFITSDTAIYNTLTREGCDVLLVDPHQIRLDGHEYGFFPGCCGLMGNKLLVCGSVRSLSEKVVLLAFLKRHHIELLELYDGPLTDVGSIICLFS